MKTAISAPKIETNKTASRIVREERKNFLFGFAVSVAVTLFIHSCAQIATPKQPENLPEQTQQYPADWTENPTAGIVLEPVPEEWKPP